MRQLTLRARSLLTFSLAVLVTAGSARAADGSFEFGVSGGVLVTDPLEVIDTTWTVVPKVGYWFNPTLAVEVDLGVAMGQTRIGDPDTYPYLGLTPRVNMLGRVFEDEPLNLLLGAGIGAFVKSVNDDGNLGLPTEKADLDFLGAAGPGLALPLSESVALRTDLRFLLNLGTENYQNRGDAMLNWEWTGGIIIGMPGAKDADKDGISDNDDSCPDEAEDYDQFEDEDGCPDTDNDGDGVLDADDECPDESEDPDGFEDANGCPDTDNDGDQVLDVDDNCPDQAGIAEFSGCPDTDGDGLMDSEDECEDEAGPKESFGCPDGDGDLVPDYRDDCPEEAAPKGINPLRSDGCVHRVYFTKKALVITETIQFDTGKATIKSASTDLLNEIAQVLARYQGIKEMQIQGHTDDQGDDDANMKLSEARANAVRDALVERGIEAGRLTAKGFGETEPIGDNTTKEGREQNRRVEFKIEKEDVGKRLKRKLRKQQQEQNGGE